MGSICLAILLIDLVVFRLGNPTHDVLEKRMAALEGGAAALVFSSGTQAIYCAILNVCGVRIVWL